jgi:hypothetical protein
VGNQKLQEERKANEEHDRIFDPMQVTPQSSQDGQEDGLLRFTFQDIEKTRNEKIAEGMGSDQLESCQE